MAYATSNIAYADLNVTSIPQTVSIIGTCNKSADIWGFLQFKMSGGITFSAENMMCFDLTKMFGAGNEPATAEEFEAMFPEIYYPYDEGTLMASPVTAINSVLDGRILDAKQIPSAVLALEGYGDGINDTVYNYVDFETKTYHKCVGVVDLGTLEWYISDAYGFYSDSICRFVKKSGICISSKYEYSKIVWINMCISISNIGNLAVADTSYTDAAEFKAAMSGVMLYYELAEPVVTDITDMFSADFNILDVMTGGKITFENENKIAVPSEVEYIVDLAEVIA